MFYFQLICFILGMMIFLGGLFLLIFPDQYKKFATDMISEQRKPWFVPVSIGMLAWVLLTWIIFAWVQTVSTFLVSVILSLSLIKSYAIVFKYEKFREFVLSFLEMGKVMFQVFATIYFALGAALLAICFAL